jgi:NTE family protein
VGSFFLSRRIAVKIVKLYRSDLYNSQDLFQQSQLVFPFFASHSKGREAFLTSVNQQGWQVTSQQGTVYFSCVYKDSTLFIQNLLQVTRNSFTWQTLVSLLESVARSRFAGKIVWVIKGNTLLEQWFIEQGYRCTLHGYEKNLTYHTALVLGGGGAHGAYQIGVWQALKKLGISFELVVGTSVGALNGALVLMDDVEAAEKLWANISSDQVLQYPKAAAETKTLVDLIDQIQSLAVTALRDNGASTQPLAQLLASTFDKDKFTSHSQLFLCTTRLPDFKEVVHQFDPANIDSGFQWLLASASFYPAMQAQSIDDNYYIDGGYRNNLPIDVAIAKGATEVISVDVQGPGINKRVFVSEAIAQTQIVSAWTLGSFLLFDANRSLDNMTLGYLETMKNFGKFSGYWYTFDEEASDDNRKLFIQWLRIERPKLYSFLRKKDFWKKMRKLYQEEVALEIYDRVFLECIGKLLHLPPTIVYTKASFLQGIREKIHAEPVQEQVGWSVSEWLYYYREQFFLLSDQKRFLFFYRTQQMESPAFQQIRGRFPEWAMLAAYLSYLFKGEENNG